MALALNQIESEEVVYENLLDEWRNNRTELVNELNEIADKIEKHNKNSRIAKLTGASASIVGTGMVIGGFFAAPFTFGSSFGLVISGGVLIGSGIVTGAGVSIRNYLLRRTNMKKVQKLIDQDREHTDEMQKQYDKIKNMIVTEEQSSPINASNAWKVTAGVGAGSDVLTDTASIFKILAPASKVLFIGGIAVGVVFDIHSLVTESSNVHNNNIAAVVSDIRKVAKEMKEQIQKVELLY